MRLKGRKALGVFLSVLMVLGSLPITVFAADGGNLTIRADVTVSDGLDASGVAFEYSVLIDGEPYTGSAVGSDGNTYEVVDGVLSLPYDVSAIISGLSNGTTYAVTRLAYDNPDFALLEQGTTQTGSIDTMVYYKSVNGGERETITAEEYNTATSYGANLTVLQFLDAGGNVYDQAESGTFTTFVEDTILGIGTGNYSETTAEFLYASDSKEIYELAVTGNGYEDFTEQKLFGRVIGYNCNNSYTTVSTNYPFADASQGTVTGSGRPTIYYSTSMSGARDLALGKLNELQADAIQSIVLAAAAASGKTAAYTGTLLSSDALNLTDLYGTLTLFTEVTRQETVYTSEEVDADKEAVFPVLLEKAPTGTFYVNLALDGTIPTACSGAAFEIANVETGDVLVAGVDYQMTSEEKSRAEILSGVLPDSLQNLVSQFANWGYAEYYFSNLAAGTYI